MLDKATVLTTIFTRVDDAMKGSTVIQDILKRSGPAPSLSESEVVTIALYQELIGEPREDHFFRLYQEQLRSYFPGLNERSCYNRCKRDLWPVMLAVRMSLFCCVFAFNIFFLQLKKRSFQLVPLDTFKTKGSLSFLEKACR